MVSYDKAFSAKFGVTSHGRDRDLGPKNSKRYRLVRQTRRDCGTSHPFQRRESHEDIQIAICLRWSETDSMCLSLQRR